MTTDELITYYANLLIIQYQGQSQNFDFVKALIKGVIMDQLPVAVQEAFDIDTAVGVQLDVIAKYVGVQRSGFGVDHFITLSDDDLRILIRLGIVRNNLGSSLADIQNYLALYFNTGPEVIVVTDSTNMHLTYSVDSATIGQDLIQMVIAQDLLPRPMGVGVSVVYSPFDRHFFGFRTYDADAPDAKPFNTYPDYHLDWPWLSYQDVT